ncbi:MAG TPA: alanine racemase [Erysipelotrichaceae bacterium]|jgi:alanine racemase|nr:alanine racemase [Erysipelotrichia bacterium]HPX32499.1 alanine racemase [Erysipelotrichaceae bacterium]HQA85196.1 alanine racemase [Erysipelotrichaceae bacterium]
MILKRCYREISKSNFRDNLKGLKNILPEQTNIIGIIKTDYYGHGAYQLAKIMQEEGVKDFAVASLAEAIELRKLGLEDSILILGYSSKEQWFIANNYNFVFSIVDYDHGVEMIEYCKENDIQLKVEIKVDTGMNRIGVNANLTEKQIKTIYDNPYLKINGTYSHLCRSDSFEESDRQFTYKQKEIFDMFLNKIKKLGLKTGRTHLCASAGILNYPDFIYDYVRPGFMLLGFDVGAVINKYKRKPVMTWKSQVEMVKTIKANEGVSYGHIYVSDKERKIASLSVGYGDGYPRRLSNKGYVLIKGQKANIVGRICMDQMMVDVTDIENVKAGDEVILIGKSGNLKIDLNELADLSETIVDEIVCNINVRVEKYFVD